MFYSFNTSKEVPKSPAKKPTEKPASKPEQTSENKSTPFGQILVLYFVEHNIIF